MLWTVEKIEGGLERRIGQPEDMTQYSEWSKTFTDPMTPATHNMTYRWEENPVSGGERRIVFDPVVTTKTTAQAQSHATTGQQAVAEKETPETAQRQRQAQQAAAGKTFPLNEARRVQLTAMSDAQFAETYAVAGLGGVPKNINRAQAVANVLQHEAKK